MIQTCWIQSTGCVLCDNPCDCFFLKSYFKFSRKEATMDLEAGNSLTLQQHTQSTSEELQGNHKKSELLVTLHFVMKATQATEETSLERSR